MIPWIRVHSDGSATIIVSPCGSAPTCPHDQMRGRCRSCARCTHADVRYSRLCLLFMRLTCTRSGSSRHLQLFRDDGFHLPWAAGAASRAVRVAEHLQLKRAGHLLAHQRTPIRLPKVRVRLDALDAAAAAAQPLLAIRRQPWRPRDGDRWRSVLDMEAAVAALGPQPKRVFLTVGRLELPASRSRLCSPADVGRCASRPARQKERHHVYMTRDGRMAMAALSPVVWRSAVPWHQR